MHEHNLCTGSYIKIYIKINYNSTKNNYTSSKNMFSEYK